LVKCKKRKMRKIILLILLSVVSYAARAQTLTVGVRGGINYSNITFAGQKDVFRPAYKISWHAGVVGIIPIKGRLTFKPEVLYSIKGYRGEHTNLDGFRRLNLSYLDVPLLAELRFGKLLVDVGPQVSFLVRAGHIVRLEGVRRYQEQNELHSKVDVGYVLGLGFRMNEQARVGVRYSGGVVPIDREQDAARAYTTARNQAIQLTLTYLFRERFF
jgi:hypothetical protein